jgi:hypothetical protein
VREKSVKAGTIDITPERVQDFPPEQEKYVTRAHRVGGYAGSVPGAYFVNAALLGARHTYDGARHLAFAATLDPQLGSGPSSGDQSNRGRRIQR